MKNRIVLSCLFFLITLSTGCDFEDKKPSSKKAPKKQIDFFQISYPTKRFVYSDSINFEIKNLSKGANLDSVVILSFNQKLSALKVGKNLIQASEMRLGSVNYTFRAYFSDNTYQDKTRSIDIYSDFEPQDIKYQIVAEHHHDEQAYTQGLQYIDGELFESTGQYKQSVVRKVDIETGKTLMQTPIQPNHFGEGLTVVDDKVYQLTWRSRTGYIFDKTTLEMQSLFDYPDQIEGWGFTWTGDHFVVSDGSNKLWFWNKDLRRIDFVNVADQHSEYQNLNELECVNGAIYANVYQSDIILKIGATSGRVIGKLDLSNLMTPIERMNLKPNDEVLNGIAYNREKDIFYLTGKDWPKLYEVKLLEQ